MDQVLAIVVIERHAVEQYAVGIGFDDAAAGLRCVVYGGIADDAAARRTARTVVRSCRTLGWFVERDGIARVAVHDRSAVWGDIALDPDIPSLEERIGIARAKVAATALDARDVVLAAHRPRRIGREQLKFAQSLGGIHRHSAAMPGLVEIDRTHVALARAAEIGMGFAAVGAYEQTTAVSSDPLVERRCLDALRLVIGDVTVGLDHRHLGAVVDDAAAGVACGVADARDVGA